MSFYRTGLVATVEVIPSAVKPYLELASGIRAGAILAEGGARNFYGRGISGQSTRPGDPLGFLDSVLNDADAGVSLVVGTLEVGSCFDEADRLISAIGDE